MHRMVRHPLQPKNMTAAKIFHFLSGLVLGISLALVGFFIFTRIESQSLGRLYVVSSGSMEPAIKTGSIVYVAPQTNYQLRDIVTFYPNESKKTTVTHRIVAIGDGQIKTAGDANNQAETSLTPTSQIVGKVVFSIPFVGFLAGFTKTPKGFIFMVIIPATIIIYEEIKNITKELRKNIKPAKISINPLYLMAILLPLLGSALVYTSFSNSFFSDLATSTENFFTVAVPEILPFVAPQNEVLQSPELVEGNLPKDAPSGASPTPNEVPLETPTPTSTPTLAPSPTPSI
jgi:signal peptidase I